MSGYTDLTKLETSRNCLRRIARHDEQQFSKDCIVNVMEKFVKTVNIMDDTILVPCRLMDRQIGDSTDIIPATGKDTTANQLTKSSSAEGKRGAAHSKNVHEFLSASELFNLYTVLNSLKKDLLWTNNQDDDDDEDNTEREAEQHQQQQQQQQQQQEIKTESNTNSNSSSSSSSRSSASVKGHVRRTSTASMMSTTSVSNLSDSDSDMSNEIDSGLESDGNKSDNAQSSDGSDIADAACQKSSDKATELARRCKRHLNGLYQCLEQMTEAANYLTARYQSDIGAV
ncbi:CTD small phosphatase-like protein 2 isoform X1 [Drosophila hydei]|uniref:CTD small phosphatase-like protein 2 isoform X1 n=2 Tax=Drosophila hydei TaxID=7224 RepID=A0A6J1MRK1_DROHY|nr:CTD small phosphatase-like protein 2 isoform X1 [Drosophila hydei]